MKNHKMPFLGIGAASIVLVLTIVCLSVFATLTLSSAQGDHTLSRKNLENATHYYEASNKANKKLAQIDEQLIKAFKKSKNKKEYIKKVSRSVAALEGVSYNKKKHTAKFQQQITKKQQIIVKIQICYPKKKNDTYYKVITWKNEAAGTWKRDDSLPVFQRK